MRDCAHDTCRGCPCSSSAVVSRPPTGSSIAVVFGWPSELEVKRDTWLTGKRGGAQALLASCLESAGADLDDIYFCSAVNCQPNPKKKAMQKNAMLACRERLICELREAGVEKVLCVGSEGFSALMGSKTVLPITKVRGRWRDAYGMKVMATLPPGFAMNQTEYFRDIVFDVVKFLDTNGREPWPNVEVQIPGTTAEAIEALDWLEEHKWLSMDLETYGFSPIANDVLAVGFGVLEDKDATVVVFDEALCGLKKIWRRIGSIVNGPIELVFHNGKFDLQHVKRQLETRNLKYDPRNIHDTMLLHYALDERPMGKYKSHGLEHLAATRYDAPDYGIGMGKWLEEFATATEMDRRRMRHEMHLYLGLDCYYTARLFPDLWNECMIEDKGAEDGQGLLDLYEKLLMPGSLALADVEYHGLLIDQPMFQKSSKWLARKSGTLLKRIQKTTDNPEFNPNSPKQVKELVYETLGMEIQAGMEAAVAQVADISSRKEGIRSRGTYTDPARLKSSATAAPILRMLARGYPEHSQLLIDICEWRNYSKNAGTYVDGLLRRVDVDGRIRGSFNLHGTASGRLSSTNPNLQNVPPASHTGIAVRSGFMAPTGYSYIDMDYKQLEVRIAAELSGDPTMLELFESGGDPHAETSHIIYGRNDVSHYERMLGKIITFGLLYGRSPDSIATGPEAEDIVARGGKRWAPEDVREFFGNLLGNWAVYAEWRQQCKEAPYRDGEITLPVGFKRRFDFIPRHDGGHAGRQGINTPCQGTASYFCLYALIGLREALRPYDAQVVSTVHDSLLIECNDEQLGEVIPLVEDVAENQTIWPTSVPLKVDLKVSKRWGQEDDEEYAPETIGEELL